MNQKRTYSLDVNINTGCQLRCEYCFEDELLKVNNQPTDEILYNLFEKYDQFLNSDYFNSRFKDIKYYFWGGEPTINHHCIKTFLSRYHNYNNVNFLCYTNGYNIEKLKDVILRNSIPKNNRQERMGIQVSFDGPILQDISRRDAKGVSTTKRVLDTINWLTDNNICFSINSVVPYKGLDKIYESYLFAKDLYLDLSSRNKNLRYSQYTPKFDFRSFVDLSKEGMNDLLELIKEQCYKIIPHDLEFQKKYNRPFFGWFSNYKKALCSAGESFHGMDYDGKVYKCHGAFYSENKQDHFISDITDDNYINKIIDSMNLHLKNNNKLMEPQVCKNCFVPVCYRCHIMKYDYSKKEGYFNKWNDDDNQKHLCKLYYQIGLINYAFRELS